MNVALLIKPNGFKACFATPKRHNVNAIVAVVVRESDYELYAASVNHFRLDNVLTLKRYPDRHGDFSVTVISRSLNAMSGQLKLKRGSL
jgi:hypothetical protein